MPPRTPLSDKELLDYSGEHLLYELQIFRWLVENIPGKQKGFELSALLESFVVHLRNLIDFFYGKREHPDDVVASEFFDSPGAWAPGAKPPSLETAGERANKEVSHITSKRKAGMHPDKPWKPGELFSAIQDVAKVFAATASPKKLHSGVKEWVNSSGEYRSALLGSASTATTNTASELVTVTIPRH